MTQINSVNKISKDLYRITETDSVHRYLILGEKKAVLFDLGYGYENVLPIVKTLTDLPVSVILSHGDPDHALGATEVSELWMHELDVGKLLRNDTFEIKEKAINYRLNKQPKLKDFIDKEKFLNASLKSDCKFNFLNDGDMIDLGNRTLKVIHTPGHSYGHIMLLDETNKMLFSGDQVTSHNIWYFFTADYQAPFEVARNSLLKILDHRNDIEAIYSAHGKVPIDISYVVDLYECLNGELQNNYKNDEPFNSFMGDGYQHFYKSVNLIYSMERLEEDLKFFKTIGAKNDD